MASRMERYRDRAVKTSRSSRNKNLYNTMYSYEKYSNIEGVASIENENEIDISKVKELLNSRDNSKRDRKYRNSTSDNYNDLPAIRSYYKEDTDRNYDIMDVLKEAREKKEPDNKERVLNNTNYDVLKKLNLKNKNDVSGDNDEDLKELIETISNTSMLNKINNADDFDMFSDLTSDDTMVGEVKDIKEFIDKNEKTMDDSFFTGNLKLKKADFVGGEKKKRSIFKTFILTLFILAFIAGVVFLILYYLGILTV